MWQEIGAKRGRPTPVPVGYAEATNRSDAEADAGVRPINSTQSTPAFAKSYGEVVEESRARAYAKGYGGAGMGKGAGMATIKDGYVEQIHPLCDVAIRAAA